MQQPHPPTLLDVPPDDQPLSPGAAHDSGVNEHRWARRPERMRKLIALTNLSPAAAAMLTRLPSAQHRFSAPPSPLPLQSPGSGHNAWDNHSRSAEPASSQVRKERISGAAGGRTRDRASSSRSTPLHKHLWTTPPPPAKESGNGPAKVLLQRAASAQWPSDSEPSSAPPRELHGRTSRPIHILAPAAGLSTYRRGSSSSQVTDAALCSTSSLLLAGSYSQDARRSSPQLDAASDAPLARGLKPGPACSMLLPVPTTAAPAPPPGRRHRATSISAAQLQKLPDDAVPSAAAPARASAGRGRGRGGASPAGSAQELPTLSLPAASPAMLRAGSHQSIPDNEGGGGSHMQWAWLGPAPQGYFETDRPDEEMNLRSSRLARVGSMCSERRVELLMAPSGSLLPSTGLWQESVPEISTPAAAGSPPPASEASCRLSRTSRSRKLPRFGPSNLVLPLDSRRSSSCTIGGGAGGEAVERLCGDRQPAGSPPAISMSSGSTPAKQAPRLAKGARAASSDNTSCGFGALLRRLFG